MKQVLTVLFLIISQLNIYGQEDNSISCSDGLDNDGDGQIDCLDSDCQSLPGDGCLICTDGISFADSLIEYTPGCPIIDSDPNGALGVSDVSGTFGDQPEFVFLGQGGSIKLSFTNNLLTNSGDSQEDLWVFEIGSNVEASSIEIRPFDLFTLNELLNLGINDSDQDGFYDIGSIGGSISGVDIDAILPGFTSGSLAFDAVKVMDVDDGSCSGETPGADIDAVCAISSITISSIEEIRKEVNIVIYPNPADEFIRFEFARFDGSFPIHYEILSPLGFVLERGNYLRGASIDIGELPNGLFILRMTGKDVIMVESFVKQ